MERLFDFTLALDEDTTDAALLALVLRHSPSLPAPPDGLEDLRKTLSRVHLLGSLEKTSCSCFELLLYTDSSSHWNM